MIDFYHTHGGRRFVDVTVPELVLRIKRVANALDRLLDLVEAARATNAPSAKKEGA